MFYTAIMVVVMVTYLTGVILYAQKNYNQKLGCCR